MLIANGATLPLGRLLLRAAKDHSACAAHAAVCAAWALSNLLFSCPPEVASPPVMPFLRWQTLNNMSNKSWPAPLLGNLHARRGVC